MRAVLSPLFRARVTDYRNIRLGSRFVIKIDAPGDKLLEIPVPNHRTPALCANEVSDQNGADR